MISLSEPKEMYARMVDRISRVLPAKVANRIASVEVLCEPVSGKKRMDITFLNGYRVRGDLFEDVDGRAYIENETISLCCMAYDLPPSLSEQKQL